MISILLTSLIIALFCTSWDILLSYEPGEPKKNQMLLYWLRKPFVNHEEKLSIRKKDLMVEYSEILNKYLADDDVIGAKECQRRRDKILQDQEEKLNYQFYLKPILLCKYCFPSFYGTIIFIMLHGFNLHLWKEWLLSIICSVILVGIISGIHEKLK